MNHIQLRLGAISLGLSALLFASFPLTIRPLLHYSEIYPNSFTIASQEFSSTGWLIAHLLGILAFVLLLFGLLTLFAFLSNHRQELYSFSGLVLSVLGIVLLLPVLGVETFSLPVIGKAYLAGQHQAITMLDMVRYGPGYLLLLTGLVMLAFGAILFAVAIWRSHLLPKWAGVCFAFGLALWYPILPQIIRLPDGILIGVGGIGLAWGIWQQKYGVHWFFQGEKKQET
jgi:hypothetical protein